MTNNQSSNSNGTVVTTTGYAQVNLVSNNQEKYDSLLENPLAINSWGIVTRPAGFGGHFWINNTDSGTSMTYVGDVGGVPLFQDDLEVVNVAAPENAPLGTISTPTGTAFSPHPTDFTITMPLDPDDPNSPSITGPGKFSFVTEDGTLSVWTENQNPDGSFVRPVESIIVADNSEFAPHNTDNDPNNDYVAIYKGVAVSTLADDNILYAADFGEQAGIYAWDENFNEIPSLSAGDPSSFANPFNSDYAPFNIQNLNGSLYVTYAKLTDAAGEEEAGLGLGGVAQFDYDGNLITTWGENPEENGNLLDAPWGVAIAPADFGEFSNALLVANFGDGRIVGYDPNTNQKIGYLEDHMGNPIEIDGIWGMVFGNGASLGEANHLYFAAGPEDESDGLFGKLLQANKMITTILGTKNDDLLIGTNQEDIIKGLAGNDTIRGEGGKDTLQGGKGDDRLLGGNGKDSLIGGNGQDTLLGEAADDTLEGNGGNDRLLGEGGKDLLIGGNGKDTILGGNGQDLILGGKGDDRLLGEAGQDILEGGNGNDRILGGDGQDLLFGGSGKDTLLGEASQDILSGDEGADRLIGGEGKDSIFGGKGQDTLLGDAGNDLLSGDAGDDRILGGDGKDLLMGVTGNDTLIGGAGKDTFVFGNGDGTDIIVDFEDGTDKIGLVDTELTFGDLSISSIGANIALDVTGTGERLALIRNLAGDITIDGSDFVTVADISSIDDVL